MHTVEPGYIEPTYNELLANCNYWQLQLHDSCVTFFQTSQTSEYAECDVERCRSKHAILLQYFSENEVVVSSQSSFLQNVRL